MNEAFDHFLNQVFPEQIEICGIKFNQAEALKHVSPVSYLTLQAAWAEEPAPTERKLRAV